MECNTCQKPAKLACGGCKSCPVLIGDLPIAHYCNAECQKSDWPCHKPICNALQDRTLLYRVAGTAQKLFFIYAELTYRYHKIDEIERSPYGLKRKLELGKIMLKGEVSEAVFWWRTLESFQRKDANRSISIIRRLKIQIGLLGRKSFHLILWNPKKNELPF